MKCPGKITKEKTDSVFDTFKNISDKYDNFIDDLWQKGSDKLREGEEKLANNSPRAKKWLSLRSYAKEVDELIYDFKTTKSAIYAKTNSIKDALSSLSKDDNAQLVKALDGMIKKDELSEHLKDAYTKIRAIIDKNASDLVEAGALKSENVIQDYIKHYFHKSVQDKRNAMKIAHNKLFARKNLTDDEKIALGMLEDGDFAIANTIKEQKEQLLIANTLKSIADKFGKDEMFDGAIRVSDESVGGGIYKYGALAGKYVDESLYKALIEGDVLKNELHWFNESYFQMIDHIKVNVDVKIF
ncbi:MAG: hypothetical protein SPI03_06215 [Campylobacter sputorum]|uniref:hypothetical protein n=1 Tax=Campylobacter sputorum TaxID=206 RepID=UPI000B784660|nr:hypothetical protein [Campylobacter sputorum]ASM38490.1 hypothetical protein CSPARA_0919 [Campylobacter sputorum bv. paraureolyticus LMG 11764]MDY6120910.1 hypothetical protein [Campylobacter sputorum]